MELGELEDFLLKVLDLLLLVSRGSLSSSCSALPFDAAMACAFRAPGHALCKSNSRGLGLGP